MLKIFKTNNNVKLLNVFRVVGTILAIFILAVAVLIYKSVKWMFNTWSNLTMDELMFHIMAPLDGTNNDMVYNYIIQCGVLTLVVVVLFIGVFFVLRKKKSIYYYSTMLGVYVCAILLGGISILYAWETLDVSAYTRNQYTYSSLIDDNYVDPASVNISFPDNKRNLVYIYLESLENTYADRGSGGAFEQNVIPELTELSIENENFSGDENKLNGAYSLSGTTWTIAAMFAQTTGLPLSIPIDMNAMNTQDTFLPGVTSLGDILEKEGYQQTLLIGSDATFGGRRIYFEQHGNYEICDYNYSVESGQIPEDYHVWWGYEDELLFEHGKEKLTELASTDQPFNFTMLTVDTHFEDGYVCELCDNQFNDQYSNVMACSSKQVKGFVDWIQKQPFYENTTIVISGDHPTMDSDFCDSIESSYNRKVYTTFINAPIEPDEENFREYSTFDNFPTTLAGLGVQIDGNRLGLGTNLFSDKVTLTELYGKEKMNNEVLKKSETMERLTEYIEPVSGNVDVSEFDMQTDSFDIIISGVEWNKEIAGVTGAVWTDENQTDVRWYNGSNQGEDLYVISVPVEDFDYYDGNYNLHIYIEDATGTKLYLGCNTINLSNESEALRQKTQVPLINANVEVLPYNYKAGKFEVVVSDLVSDTEIQSIRCAVWNDEDQSDLKWYEAKKKNNGDFVMSVLARDFYFKEAEYNIHVYAIDQEGVPRIISETTGKVD